MSDRATFLRPPLAVDYGVDLRIFRTRAARLGALLLGLVVLALPLVTNSFWLSIVNFSMIAAIGALGLNLVSGDAGQVSLGHAFFLGVGAYAGAWFSDLGWPFLVWMVAAGLVAAAASLLIGPFALKLRGLYLAFATVALVFLGQHLFLNLGSITGGGAGRPVPAPELLSTSLAQDSVFLGLTWTGEQKWFVVLVPLVAVVALGLRNLQRTRLGRALHSIRDHDVAAWVTGVELSRRKVEAFVVGSFLAGVAGALLGSYLQYITPDYFGLLLSVQYLAMIIVGGMSSVLGSVLGAVFITAMPRLIDRASDRIPFVESGLEASGSGLTVELLANLLYGLVVVVFLVAEPEGLVGIWRKTKRYFQTWPYRY